MSRSQRYIPPSDAKLERLRQASEAAEQFDLQRESLLRSAIKKIKKADLGFANDWAGLNRVSL